MASEAYIQAEAIKVAKKLGAIHIRMVFRPGLRRGWPDVLFIFPGGKNCWIEFKATGKEATPLQDRRITELKEKKQLVFVCDSIDKARVAFAHTLDTD